MACRASPLYQVGPGNSLEPPLQSWIDLRVIKIMNSFTYPAKEEICLRTLCSAQILAASYRKTVEDYVFMLSKRIRDISRLISDGPDGPSSPIQAPVDTLHSLIQTGMKWLEELAEIEIQSKQRWFELQRRGIMTNRETMRYENIRTNQESWDRKRKALLACAMAGTGPRIMCVPIESYRWSELVDHS